jgi:hypothetical protein
MSFGDIRLLNRNMMHDYAVMEVVARINGTSLPWQIALRPGHV